MKMIVLAALALLFTTTSQAQYKAPPTKKYPPRAPSAIGAYTNELMTNLTGAQLFLGKECKDCASGSRFILDISYLHTWKDNMQYGGEAGMRILSKEYSGTGDSETLFDLVGVGVYNLESDFANSLYAKAGVGFYATPKENRTDGYETKLGMFIGAGKRFEFLRNVTYTPEFRFIKRGDIDFGMEFNVINFSIVW